MDNEKTTIDEEKDVNTLPPQTGLMSNAGWEQFSKGDLLNFLMRYSLQKITIEDGAGKKATVKLNSKGEYNVTYTSTEVF